MRIDCEKCGVAFTIDDALIGDRGVRAQCPRCGEQKVVRKTVAPAPAMPSSTMPSPAMPSSLTPTSSSMMPSLSSLMPSPSSTSPLAPPAAGANPFAAPGGGGNPFAPPFGSGGAFGAPLSSSPSPLAAPVAPPAPSNPFSLAAPADNRFSSPSAPVATNPFGTPALAASSASAPPFAPTAADPFAALSPSSPPQPARPDPFAGHDTLIDKTALAPPGDPFAAPPGDPFAAPPGDPFSTPSGIPSGTPYGTPSGIPSGTPYGTPSGIPYGTPSGTPSGIPYGAPSAAAFAAAPAARTAAPPDVDPFAPPPGAAAPAREPWPRSSPPASADPFAARLPAAPSADLRRDAVVSGKWVVRGAAAGVDDETVDLAELRERVKRGDVSPDDVAGPVGGAMKPVKDTPLLAVSLPGGGKKERVQGATAARRGLDVPRPLVWFAAVALAAGGGFAVYKAKPELFERQSEAGENPLRRARPVWQRQFPEVQGTSLEHLAEARRQMRLDTAAGYRRADDELRQALLLDVGNTAALAAWVENLANTPRVRADVDSSTLAFDALEHALKREPDGVELLRAQGALLLALGRIDEAQRVLGRALKLSPGDVHAKLLLARSDIDRNAADALEVIQRDVRARDPDNKLAQTIEAAARRRLGDLRQARELLAARLASDPQNVGALRELARLELDVGNADAAVTALSTLLAAEDNDVESHLLRAKINYQLRGGAAGLQAADEQLDALLAAHERDAGDLLVPVLAHATFVKTRRGALDRAIELGERARALDAGAPSALYALGRAYAARGDLDNAKKALEQAVRATSSRDQFFEPLLRAELAAVQGRSGDVANAIRNAERAIEIDRLNLRAYFGLAALYVQQQKFTQAIATMRKTLANDPAWEHDRRVPTDYPTLPADLEPFAAAFQKPRLQAGDESQASLIAAAEGIVRYAAGQTDRAEKLLQQALKADAQNPGAILYLSIIDLQKGRAAEARERLRQLIASTPSQPPVTLLYMGRAELAGEDLEAARKRLGELAEAEPGFVQARYSLAMVMRAQKLDAQANELLRAVVKQDPDFLPARQALDQQP